MLNSKGQRNPDFTQEEFAVYILSITAVFHEYFLKNDTIKSHDIPLGSNNNNDRLPSW